jgi:uncharacterized protein YlxW (UPF0749 family)
MVVTAVSVLALLGVSVYAAVTYQRAARWQSRSAQLETRLADTSEELEQTDQTLDETKGALANRKEKVAELEDRVAAVTAEREKARDTVARLNDDLDMAASVVGELSAIGADLSVCVDELFAWIGSQPSVYATQSTWNAYFARGRGIADGCGQARDDFDAFLQATQP